MCLKLLSYNYNSFCNSLQFKSFLWKGEFSNDYGDMLESKCLSTDPFTHIFQQETHWKVVKVPLQRYYQEFFSSNCQAV